MSDERTSDFIVDVAEETHEFHGEHRTGWESVIFDIEDEEGGG